MQASRSVRPPHNPPQALSNLEDSEVRDESDAALTPPGHKAVLSHVRNSRERSSEDLDVSLVRNRYRSV